MSHDAPAIYHAFTVKNTSLVNQLISEAWVIYCDKRVRAKALWDTGATGTCIAYNIVKQLALLPTGRRNIKTPSGCKEVNTYLVDILLPNKVCIRDVVVCDSDIGDQGIDVLIGMDVILCGDFSVSAANKKTTFSFRLPSKQATDFVQQINFENARGPKHGKGNKKRKK